MTANLPEAPLKVLLYESEGSNPLSKKFRVDFISALLNDGVAVHSLKQGTEVEFDAKEPLCIVGDFDKPPIDHEIEFIAVNNRSVEDVLADVKAKADTKNSKRTLWKPWFPVIDYDRCTNCMQCLTFCLFDVYSVKDSQITVTNEDKCKTDCPACSRVCPEVAILFPKYSKGPINGDVVKEEDIKREKMKVDISSLLGGDILSKLRTRHTDAKNRFSKERDESKALRERERCLKKLKEELDIPDSVLKSLPTAAMIDAKTQSMVDKQND
jgi:Pyruvate/2-oxoacid:ferredoxin oxidoreductase delta subunit